MKYQNLFQGLVFTSLWLILFFILAFLGWPGKIHFCVALDHCYCETIQWNALIVQPINTLSNLVIIFIGLYLLFYLDKLSLAEQQNFQNPMTFPSFHSRFYGFLVIFIGIGSMFFHGSMTQFGGLIDNISMNMYISFLICYNFQRIFKFSNAVLLGIFCTINIILGWMAILPDIGRHSFSVLVIGEIAIELIVLLLSNKKRLQLQRDWKLFLLCVLVFGFAALVWQLSKTGGIFCYPDSFWQGHALWHYLDGLSTLVIFRYIQSEKAK